MKKLLTYINPASGSYQSTVDILRAEDQLKLVKANPEEMRQHLQQAINDGVPRVAVCGGDGTLALAASLTKSSNTELAIIPGGTLNHFAKRHGIPDSLDEAVELAIHGQAGYADIGTVNDRIFLNTSSVGAYVSFVRSREQLEERLSYSSASIVAAILRLFRLSATHIYLDDNLIKTPLVFVGVGERELSFPFLGDERDNGKNGLHLIAVRSENRFHTVKVAISAVIRGVDPLHKARELDARMVNSIQLGYRKKRKSVTIALDGELIKVTTPLQYRFIEKGLKIVKG